VAKKRTNISISPTISEGMTILPGMTSSGSIDYAKLGLPMEATTKDIRKALLEIGGKKAKGRARTGHEKSVAEIAADKARRAAKAKKRREERNAYLRSLDPTGQKGIAPRKKGEKMTEEERKAKRAERGKTRRKQQSALAIWAKENMPPDVRSTLGF